MSSVLSQDIQREYNRMVKSITPISPSERTLKIIEGTGGKVGVTDVVAYQIGWGHCVIRWYEAGIQGKIPEMPGEGFSTWDYVGIARQFYQKYQYDSVEKQMAIFHQVVSRILEIVEEEDRKGNLDQLGIWLWCTLPSGKQWPLSKWVKINTSAPYKRATSLIKRAW
jgi:hypothetical protein